VLDAVVVDIETTGTNPKSDRITEIGAVRIESGRIVETFETLTDPKIHIPPFITQLTGLSDADVRGAPTNAEATASFERFRRGLPAVAHNAEFDLSFLSEHGCAVSPTGGVDTAELSRLAWPTLERHSLAGLAAFVRTTNRRPHRALPDAETTAEVYLQILLSLCDLSQTAWERSYHLSQGVSTGTTAVLRFIGDDNGKAAVREAVAPVETREELQVDLNPLIGIPQRRREPTGNFDVDELRSALGEGGLLAAAIGDRFEPRDVQTKMALLVARALVDDEHLLVEAGTGVGKSLAYLLPSAHFAQTTGERVVVSTRTRALQEQLLKKDLPLLAAAVPFDLSAALLKGRSNYLCGLKFTRFVDGPVGEESRILRRAALSFVRWVEETKSGDVAECAAFHPRSAPGLWAKLCCEHTFCTGRKCAHFDHCFLFRARRAAEGAHVVAVNHNLLLANAAADEGVLGPVNRLVVDEAQHLEDVAADALATRVEWWPVSTVCDRLALVRRGRHAGLISDVHNDAQAALSAAQVEPLTQISDSAVAAVGSLRETAQRFFRALSGHLNIRLENDDWGTLRLLAGDTLFESLSESANEYQTALRQTSAKLASLCDLVTDSVNGDDSLQERLLELRARAEDITALSRDIEAVWGADREDWVYWAQRPPSEERIDSALVGVPLDVGELLRERLFDRVGTAVLTSATLTVGRSFDYMASRLGLSDSPRLAAEAYGSPFDFESQMRCAVAAFLPGPNEHGHRQEADELLATLVGESEVNTLVLATSKSAVRSATALLKERLEPAGRVVMGQWIDGPPGPLTERLRRTPGGVLVGTDTLWEGVDLPGAGVELVVILRLPFAVPTDPLVAARVERIEARGGNGFYDLSVPVAVLRFRQGFGRLVRSKTDRGAVVVLDSRMATARYGRRFVESVPIEPVMCDSKEELLEEVVGWLKG
jgi:ATP-dependent DNA helicase DinG